MDSLHQVQQLQLKLITSASVNENCAIDLMEILFNLTPEHAQYVLDIIEVLLSEAEVLRGVSRDVTARHFVV
jgi:hypothetical protein